MDNGNFEARLPRTLICPECAPERNLPTNDTIRYDTLNIKTLEGYFKEANQDKLNL